MACKAIRSEFDIFARRPLQTAVVSSRVTHYKPIAPVNQSDLEFVIPGDGETYVDLNIHMSLRGKLVALHGSALDLADSTTVVNNLLHSPFSQCSVNPKRSFGVFIQGSPQLQGLLRDSTHLRAPCFAKSSHKHIVVSGRRRFFSPQPTQRRLESRLPDQVEAYE